MTRATRRLVVSYARAKSIAAENRGRHRATFLGQKNINYGVDRIVAITSDAGYVCTS